MWREPLGRALTRQTDGVNTTILDDSLDAQGGTSCRNCSWTSSPHWTVTGPRRAGPMVGTRRTRISRLARPAAGTRLHDLEGANTYRLMSGFATESRASASVEAV